METTNTEERIQFLEAELAKSEGYRMDLIKKIEQKEGWRRAWAETHIEPLIERVKSLGFEIGYGFENGRNGDVSHSNIFDAVNLALDELTQARASAKSQASRMCIECCAPAIEGRDLCPTCDNHRFERTGQCK